MRIIIVLAALAALNACAQSGPVTNRPAGSGAVAGDGRLTASDGWLQAAPAPAMSVNYPEIKVEDDPYESAVEYTSQVVKEGGLDDSLLWILIGKKDRQSGAKLFYVQLSNVYTSRGWRYFHRANDQTAKSLETTQIDRNVVSCYRYGRCTYTEMYNIYIPNGDLLAAGSDGYSFKIFARDGTEKVVSIPPAMIRAMIDKISS